MSRKPQKWPLKVALYLSLVDQISSCAFSQDEKHIFLAGGADTPEGIPKIAAVRADSSLKQEGYTELDLTDFRIIFCLEKYPNSDLLFAGGYGQVALVYFNGIDFEIMASLGTPMEEYPICDLCFISSNLYVLLEPSTMVLKFEFTDPRLDEHDGIKGSQKYRSQPLTANETIEMSNTLKSLKSNTINLPSSADSLVISRDSNTIYLIGDQSLSALGRSSGSFSSAGFKNTSSYSLTKT